MTAPLHQPSGSDLELRDAVRRLRVRWRRRILAEGAAKVAIAALLALLAGVIVTKLVGVGGTSVVTVRVIGYLLIAAAAVRYLIGPFLGRLDDARFALYVEERAPELRQVLVSAVHELATPETARPSPALSGRLMTQALNDVRRLDAGPGLEGSRFRRAAGILAGAGALAALLIAVGPPVLRDVARVLFIPWSEAAAAPVFAVQVEPGNATVPRGGALEIRATLRGFEAEGAELVLRADTASEWIRLPMLRDSAAAEFTARLFDLTSATEYYAESNEIRSRVYKLTIADLPAVSKFSLELRFPGYTGLPVERIEEGGDVATVRGTTVTVRATTSRRVQSGAIRLDDGTTVPMTADSAGLLTGSFRVARDGFYRLDLVATDGTAVPGAIQYVVEALEDQPPGVRIEEPGRDTKVTSVDEVTIAMRATDDYGVGSLELHYAVNGGAEKKIALSDSTARRTRLDARAAHTLFLEELGLKPGDLVSYFATAKDGGGNTASSDIYFLEIRPFGRDYKQAESGGGGGGGGGGETPEGLSARQRDLVAGTFNWLRDSARVKDRERRENVTTLAIGQGRLKTDVEALVRRLVERNIVSADTNFRLIHAALDSAAKEMQAAEDRLGRGQPREALPREQRALQLVQRAEAAYREVQVQMGGQQGGGGGGGASQAEDLADLFELENDKLRNQYESVQQEQEQAAQRELDETAERLKRLASRQQQENERMQRMADAMRDRLGQQGGGGGGGGSSQRELAREAEEEARRLERLAREKNSPELADAARRMQDAAEAMRRAASGSPNAQGQGGTALERLRSATQKLENARAGSAAQDVKELQRRAEELGQRQREIAEGVAGLPGASGTERGEQMRRLSERKDGLSSEVSRLEADAERLARETRRDQPGSANKLSEAAGAIRDTRLRDKIAYSKALMGSSSTEAIRNLEGLIGENLDEVAEKIRSAAGALSENAGVERDRALEKARDLVKGLESLRDRIGERGMGNGERGQQGQQGQQGERGTGNGERGQQGQQGQGQGQGQQGQGQQGQGGRQGQGDPSQPGQGSQLGMPGGGQTGGGGQPGRLNGGDARQFSREFGLRRQAAEGLRRELAGQEMDQAELDRIIADLRRLESGRPFSDPQGLEELQRAVIEGLKTWEFKLWRSLSQSGENRPALGAPSQVPAEYRALVEEYYRSLGKKPK